MAIFTDTDLDGFSDLAIELAFKDSCEIQREVNSVWVTQATVPCMLMDATIADKQLNDEQTTAVLKSVLMPRNTDVRSPDRLKINSLIYRVQEIKEPSSFEVVRRVLVVRFPQRGGA